MRNSMSQEFWGFGLGVGTRSSKGDWLEVFYPKPHLQLRHAKISAFAQKLGYTNGNVALSITAGQIEDLAKNFPEAKAFVGCERPLVATFLENDEAPKTVPEAYLKLHMLSHRLIKPHGLNLNGIFKILLNVAWTNKGAIDLADLPTKILAGRLQGDPLLVHAIDKFPRLTDYVVPSGVRIADASRVRLGAYLGEGTTVMHEGFVNYNAGTEGPNMVEGRISAGVMVGSGTDLGGGCSTMGTLSGGNDVVISVGRNCLIGANAGLGIPLGNDCTIEAGLYLTAASKVQVLSLDGQPVKTMKALDLAGRANLLFRRNSLTGAVECLPNKTSVELNQDLHATN
jgi:2,3,4,5-tetrahydropyridine-2-carboxylate N-succinyltransferase